MITQDLEFIYQSLMHRTKIQLSHLGELFGCELKSNLRKFEMATGLADYIINRSDEWLRCLPQMQEMMGVVQEYMNNVPKWIFKGYSSHEVFEKYEKPSLHPLFARKIFRYLPEKFSNK